MTQIHVAADRVIHASPDRIFDAITDAHQHQRFLPPAFSNVVVEKGGRGAGTVLSFNVKAGGRTRHYRMAWEVPASGQVLVERDLDSSLVTTFTVAPEDSGSRVTIETRWQGAGGMGGFFERTFAPRVMRKMYADELQRLEEYIGSA